MTEKLTVRIAQALASAYGYEDSGAFEGSAIDLAAAECGWVEDSRCPRTGGISGLIAAMKEENLLRPVRIDGARFWVVPVPGRSA